MKPVNRDVLLSVQMDIFDKNGVVVAIILNNFITSDAMHFATNVASYVACADGGANRLHDDTNGLFFQT